MIEVFISGSIYVFSNLLPAEIKLNYAAGGKYFNGNIFTSVPSEIGL